MLSLWDHPRSRGVYGSEDCSDQGRHGSSPLARGLRLPRHQCSPTGRIIPARAGFTPPRPAGGPAPPDHPRSRGVYHFVGAFQRRPWGSSPLARGLLTGKVPVMEDGGIIPARAGFTLGLPPRRRGRRDHPRSHGVYQWDEFLLICSLGSSPLARGLHGRAHRRLRHPRIIPARAGFTCPASPAPRSSQDHPRSRGVYDPRPAGRVADLGSSPLARGLRRHPLLHRRLPGIIPARAGFTMASWRPACQRADHPRSRGVYGRQRRRANAARGSSPLARGLQIQLHLRRKQPGIIPARAGFTNSTG